MDIDFVLYSYNCLVVKLVIIQRYNKISSLPSKNGLKQFAIPQDALLWLHSTSIPCGVSWGPPCGCPPAGDSDFLTIGTSAAQDSSKGKAEAPGH